MYILGVSCYYHDAAAALLKDGQLIAAADEERFSRVKHDSDFPAQAIAFCLKQAGIRGADLDYVVFYEKPLVKFERILMTALGNFPASYPVFRESMVVWFNQKLWIKSKLQTEIGIAPERILFTEHHMAHAASALYCSPFQEAAILTVDGVGEWVTATIGQGTACWEQAGQDGGANRIELFSEVRFPHSLGLLYSAFTAYLGFKVNNGEYKVMGMAPFGQARYTDLVYRLIDVADDGSFCLNMDYFSYPRSTRRTYNRRFIELFGPARTPESPFYTRTTHPDGSSPGWSEAVAAQNQKHADIAASIQQVTEEVLLKMARYAHRRTGHKNLVMAGGVALNSVANGRIMRETPFEQVYIQPAAGDGGGALGAALYAYHVLLDRPRAFVMEHAYWGAAYPEAEMVAAIERSGYRYEQLTEEALTDRIVDRILEGKVVGWYRDRFE
jgi:carbamoyltransferase